MTETEPVTFQVTGIEAVHGAGRLLHLAIVRLDLAGVEIVVQGVQVIRRPDGRLAVRAPTFRHPRDGRSLPVIILPVELRDAIAREVLTLIGARISEV